VDGCKVALYFLLYLIVSSSHPFPACGKAQGPERQSLFRNTIPYGFSTATFLKVLNNKIPRVLFSRKKRDTKSPFSTLSRDKTSYLIVLFLSGPIFKAHPALSDSEGAGGGLRSRISPSHTHSEAKSHGKYILCTRNTLDARSQC
jgi:hypothetical protein